MKNTLKFLVFLSSFPMMWIAHAQTTYMYMCKDAGGRTITSDRPIPECADRAVKELDRSGMVRREIPPPLTPEQRREQKLKQEKAKADAAALEEQRQSDRLLLARYASEKDIEASRKRSLDLVQEQLKRETKEMAAAEATLKTAQAEADAQMKRKAPSASLAKRRATNAEQAVLAARKAIEERQEELVQIDAKYDQALKRYREIAGGAAAK